MTEELVNCPGCGGEGEISMPSPCPDCAGKKKVTKEEAEQIEAMIKAYD
jgi:DnaJ-class molecular chaperone